MTLEELLKPRYEVIALTPLLDFNIGEIYTTDFIIKVINGNQHYIRIDIYPHLFKRLEWWESRKIEDMPKYVKQVGYVDIYNNSIADVFLRVTEHFNTKSKDWRDKSFKVFYSDEDNCSSHSYSGFKPATEEEYNAFKQTI